MQKGSVAYEKIVFLFGDDICLENGEIDRKKLGSLIFKEKNKRIILNAIVHPLVKNEILKDIEEARNDGFEYYFIEAALLFDDHYENFCDVVWYVNASKSLRKQRLITYRGYSESLIDDIFSSQMTDEYIQNKYLTKNILFNDSLLDGLDFIKLYEHNEKKIITIDNSKGSLLTIEFHEALIKLFELLGKEEVCV